VFVVLAVTGCGGAGERPSPGELARAAGRGDLEAVERLLDRGAAVNDRGEGGQSAVTAAVYAGSAPVVRALVNAGADVDLQDDMRANALLATGETGDVEVLREVLRPKPDLTRTNRFGGTALIPAADRGHVDVVRELLQTEIDVDHANDLGWTALLEAVILGDGGAPHREIVQLLVDAGADLQLADREGVTALEHARRNDYDEIVTILEAAGL
jgi:ankyrin repeat protein